LHLAGLFKVFIETRQKFCKLNSVSSNIRAPVPGQYIPEVMIGQVFSQVQSGGSIFFLPRVLGGVKKEVSK
jgi:hypothetical protein